MAAVTPECEWSEPANSSLAINAFRLAATLALLDNPRDYERADPTRSG